MSLCLSLSLSVSLCLSLSLSVSLCLSLSLSVSLCLSLSLSLSLSLPPKCFQKQPSEVLSKYPAIVCPTHWHFVLRETAELSTCFMQSVAFTLTVPQTPGLCFVRTRNETAKKRNKTKKDRKKADKKQNKTGKPTCNVYCFETSSHQFRRLYWYISWLK